MVTRPHTQVCNPKMQGECYEYDGQDGLVPISAIDILADCNAFVAGYSSNLASVIFQLARARGNLANAGTHPTVDVSWNRII